MINLTELEYAVLTKLLVGEHPLLEQLRNQLQSCKVKSREMTGHGFFTYFAVENTMGSLDVTVQFGDVGAEINGMAHGAGFELFVEHGRLDMLEGYGYDDPWPATITGYSVKYINSGELSEERDWAKLKRAIG